MDNKEEIVIKLQDLSSEELYLLGKEIGRVAEGRPDISHRVLVGFRDGLNEVENGSGYGFGDVFWFLWRRGNYKLPELPPLPFTCLLEQPSGAGKL